MIRYFLKILYVLSDKHYAGDSLLMGVFMKYKYLMLFTALFVASQNVNAEEELCSRATIVQACEGSQVSTAKEALDCYKGAKFYAGITCDKSCKEKLLYCVDNEKVNLTNIFSDQ